MATWIGFQLGKKWWFAPALGFAIDYAAILAIILMVMK